MNSLEGPSMTILQEFHGADSEVPDIDQGLVESQIATPWRHRSHLHTRHEDLHCFNNFMITHHMFIHHSSSTTSLIIQYHSPSFIFIHLHIFSIYSLLLFFRATLSSCFWAMGVWLYASWGRRMVHRNGCLKVLVRRCSEDPDAILSEVLA